MAASTILLTNASVVLVIKDPPPSATHEFLVKHQIIPETFQVQGAPFYTPPISQIIYNNGFRITTEPNRILLQVLEPTEKIEEQKNYLDLLEQISLKYVEFFSDIKCQSLGINFQIIRDGLAFQSFVEQTVKSDSQFLVFENNKGDVKNLNVSYNWRGKQLNMAINKAQKQRLNHPPHPSDVVLFDINISYPSQYSDNKAAIIKELKENFEKVQQFMEGF